MSESSCVLRSRKQVVSMLTAVVIFFFACMMPFKIFILWIITLDKDVDDVISMETYYLLLYFCRVMFYINSAINPILYNIMSSRFHEGFLKLFNCDTLRVLNNWSLRNSKWQYRDRQYIFLGNKNIRSESLNGHCNLYIRNNLQKWESWLGSLK